MTNTKRALPNAVTALAGGSSANLLTSCTSVVDNALTLCVPAGMTHTLSGDKCYGQNIFIAGTLLVSPHDGQNGGSLVLRAPQIEVTNTGLINADAAGRAGGAPGASLNQGGGGGQLEPGAGCGGGRGSSVGQGGSGGGYGGGGGTPNNQWANGNACNSCNNPTVVHCEGNPGVAAGTNNGADYSLGNGGGAGGNSSGCANSGGRGGKGGGVIFLLGTQVILNGTLTAAGEQPPPDASTCGYRPGGGGGSGGAVLVRANAFSGAGMLRAPGGAGGHAPGETGSSTWGWGGGGGGGGRVKIFAAANNFTGNSSAAAGAGGTSCPNSQCFPGDSGTAGTTFAGAIPPELSSIGCQYQPCNITVGTPAPGTLNLVYNSSVAATPAAPAGFVYQYSLANSTALPAGLSLNSGNGGITGTPTTPGNVSFDIKAELFNSPSNISTGCSTTSTRSINITCVNNPVVQNNNDNGTGSLREAIAIACPGSTITFANAVVSPISMTSGELVINKNLTIQGPGVDMMTVDGVGERVFNIAAGSYDVTITGLTITNGVASGADPVSPGGSGGNGRGGGLFNQSTGTVNITNCLFRTNYAIGGNGGAVAGGSGGAGMGGAIYQANGGTLQITQTSFFGNEAAGGDNDNSGGSGSNNNGLGAVIYNASNATVRVTDSTVAFGIASGGLSGNGSGGRGNGGGIYNVAGTVIVSRSIFYNNNANGGHTNFGNRTAGQGAGAGIYNETGTVTVSNSTFTGNVATGGNTGGSNGTNGIGNGGGFFNASTGAVTLINVTVSLNNAVGGNSIGSPTNGTGQGGGLHNASTGVFTVLNTISADNMASTNHPDVFGTFASLGYNLIQTVGTVTSFTATGDQTGVSPMLGPLANDGGLTETLPLLPGSPAINMANNCVLTANGCGNGNPALTTDQRGAGFPRSSGTRVDIGAFEVACQSSTAMLSGSPTICAGTSGTISVTVSGGIAPYTVTLNNGGGTQTGNGPTLTFTVNPAVTTTYAIASAMDAIGCTTTASGSATVTVNQLPVATTGSAQIICQGATTTALGGNTPPTGTVGLWTSNSGGTFSNATSPGATWTPPSNFSGIAQLTWTVSSPTNCGTTQTATVQVNVNATPVASTGSAQIICQGATTAALGGNTLPFGTVGQWTSNSGGTFSNATSPSATWTPPSNFNGIAQLTWTVSSPTNCGTAATANVQVTVNATPVATAGAAQIICQGATTPALGGNTPPFGTTGAWTSNSGGTFSNATSPSATWTPAANFTGIAQLTWTVSSPTNCGTTQTATVQVTVNATPVASAGSAQTICQAATTAALGGNTAPFGTVGQWTSNSGGSFNPNATTPEATWTPTANFTGTATLTWTVSSPTNCGTAQTATVQVTVAGAPTVTDPVNQNVLQGGTATFSVTASGSVQWQVSINNGPFTNLPGANNATLTLPNVTAVMSGNRYRAVVTSSCNVTATSNPATLFVSVYGGQVTDPLVCTGPGNTVQVTLVITNNGNVSQAVTDTTTFTNLVGVPGSCVASPNVGTCTITNAGLSYSGTLAAGQTVTLTYLTQVSNTAATGAQVCSNNTVTFPNSPPITFSVCDVVDCPATGPGNALPAAAEMSDQKAGSVLIYNVYTSSTDPTKQNTRLNLTNTHPTLPAYVHLFFVAEGCSVADSYVCLTANQTTSFLASDLDPGTTGYLVAVAVDGVRGCPTNFNYLIGDEYVKFASGHAANLAAQSFAAIAGGLPACDGQSVTATLNFDGVSYNRLPAVLALSNVGSRADGNDMLLIVNRIGGNLGIGAATLGTLFGVFYDDAENALSFSVAGNCQLRNSITNNFPRTTPRFETFIPAGRTGWLKVFNQTGAAGLTGAAINFNANAGASAGAFNQGHNLHGLTLNATSNYVIPIFPPSC